MHRSHHSVIIVFFQCTQACQPGWCVDWRIILERVKEKRKEEVKEETCGERRRKREREMEGREGIQWRLKGCFAREDPISRSTSNQWPAERLVSGAGEGRGCEEREEEGYWSDELRKNRPNESTAHSRERYTLSSPSFAIRVGEK